MNTLMQSVCVDLDGTLAQYRGDYQPGIIGDPIDGAREFMEKLFEKYWVIVHTCRFEVGSIETWLIRNRIPFGEVHCGKGKPHAVAYVDDRAVECRPQAGGVESYNRAIERIDLLAEKWSSELEHLLTITDLL